MDIETSDPIDPVAATPELVAATAVTAIPDADRNAEQEATGELDTIERSARPVAAGEPTAPALPAASATQADPLTAGAPPAYRPDTVADAGVDGGDEPPTAAFTLADLVAAGVPAAHLPAARLDVALLGTEPDGTITVLHTDGRLELLDPAARAVPLADPVRGAAALAEVLVRHDALHAERLDALAAERAGLEQAHQQRLAEIRDYAVARYVDNEICRTGLDDFLDHFDLEPYRPRLVVTFMLHGQVSVDGDDADCVRSDARYGLRVDASDLDDVVDGSLLLIGTEIEVEREATDD